MSSDKPDRDRNEDLSELLDDLGATLAELRSELQQGERPDNRRDTTARRTRRDRPGAGSGLPRPPSVSDLLGFTEQYTLPTIISTLEATIRALELLRGSLRLVNPDRSGFESPSYPQDRSPASRLSTGAAGVGREAVSGVERALSELETALAESDVPRDRASNELLGEARDLSAEVRARLEAAQDAGDTGRGRRQDGDRGDRREPSEPEPEPEPEPGADGVAIEVTDGSDGADPDADGDSPEDEPRPEVDIEAELASIRQEVNGAGDADPAEREAGDGDTSDREHGGDSDGDDDVTVDGSERGNDGAESTADSGDSDPDGAGSGDSPHDDNPPD